MTGSYDLAVVGGGPAGMASAIAARRLGLSVVLFESLALGGELARLNAVEGFPGRRGVTGPDLVADLIDDLLDLDVVIEYVEVTSAQSRDGRWILDDRFDSAALVLACGREPDLDAVRGAKERVGRGVSTCSSCDGPLFRGKRVAVVGSGEHAFSMASELSPFAESVTVLAPHAITASPRSVAAVEASANVTVVEDRAVDGVVGLPVEAVHVSGPGGSQVLEVEGLFLGTRRIPAIEPFKGLGGQVTDLCHVDSALEIVGAGNPPVFAIGDVRETSSQTVIGAMGDGTSVAWAVAERLHGIAV